MMIVRLSLVMVPTVEEVVFVMMKKTLVARILLVVKMTVMMVD